MESRNEKTVPSSLANRIFQLLKRFGQDLMGIVLIAVGVISFLNIFNLTTGKLIDKWTDFLSRGFGWTVYLTLGILIFTGVLILFRRFERFPKLDFGKIILLELEQFSLAALLSAVGGFSVERANLGYDGGLIGWGTSHIITNIFGNAITYILLYAANIFLVIGVLGIGDKLRTAIDSYFSEVLSFGGEGTRVRNSREKHIPGSLGKEIENDGGVFGEKKYSKSKPEMPPTDILLDNPSSITDESYIHAKAVQIEKTMDEFGVPARVAGYRVGPTIIQYAVEPGFVEKISDAGSVLKKKVRVSQIVSLKKDLALSLSVDRLRIEAPIPGHAFVGIEIPNLNSVLVRLKSILESEAFRIQNSPLGLALGLDVSGNPITADLGRMPHLLVAGTTGSGKSVCITSIITCIVMNNSPEDLKLAILDPKMVELVRFNGLPHLMGKVETQMDRMLAVLAWAIKEMEDRYKKLELVNARDLDSYNDKMLRRGEDTLPKIVIVIDELADLMLTEPEKSESYLVRLAQMARAVGIHLVVATQRPSTDIVTGLIKANFPARISFMMTTSIDSRVILDTNGAETLMGKGDMLYLDPETARLIRAQCVLVDDREIENVINFWQAQAPKSENVMDLIAPWENLVEAQTTTGDDNLLIKAIELVRKDGYATTSRLQRILRIGFPRAARLMDELEERGVVGPQESGGKVREVLPEDPESEDSDG